MRRSHRQPPPEIPQTRRRHRALEPGIIDPFYCVIFRHDYSCRSGASVTGFPEAGALAPAQRPKNEIVRLLRPALPSRIDLFRNAHFRAARARIHSHFFVTRLNHFLRQHAKTPFPRQALKRVLHQTIFERVIAEDDPASSRIQSGRGPRKKLPEFLLFSIHRYPQRQKRFCRGMQFLPSPCFSNPCHNRCQVFGVANGPRPHDAPGDSA